MDPDQNLKRVPIHNNALQKDVQIFLILRDLFQINVEFFHIAHRRVAYFEVVPSFLQVCLKKIKKRARYKTVLRF